MHNFCFDNCKNMLNYFFATDIMLSYYFDFPECEQLWVRVKNILSSDQTIVIGVLYRHPKSNSIDFLEMLSSTLSIIARSSMKCIILGDLNIDLLSTSKFSLSYINNLKSYGFVPIYRYIRRRVRSKPCFGDGYKRR